LAIRLTPSGVVEGGAGDSAHRALTDSTVTLAWQSPDGQAVSDLDIRLLLGEARSIAAMLVRAADRIDFAGEDDQS
jgi:hypothetical protein